MSVDPGTRHCGIAIWVNGTLTRAYLAKAPDSAPWLAFLDQLPESTDQGIVEIPQIYPPKPGQKKRAKPEDIIQLTASAGAIAGRIKGHWTQARPAVWTRKTCQDKEIRLARAWDRLTDAERSIVEMPKAKLRQADVLDAIALGLHALKRF